MSTELEVRSPCVSICALDADGVCIGCYRTADEITDWFMASASDKQAIVARAAARRDGAAGWVPPPTARARSD